jgi:hypothetical protein
MDKRIELQIVADNSQYLKGAKEVTQATQQMEDKSKEFNKSQKTLISQTGEAYKKVAQESSKAFNTKEMDAYKTKTKETADAVQGVGGAAGRAVGGVKALSNAFKALLANPVVLVITAIVGALAGLIKLFKSTDKGATEIQARFEQLKAILDVLRQRVLSFTSAIGNLFKGNWKQAGEDMKATFSGIGQQMRLAADAAYVYIKALDAIEDAEKNYVSTAAENRNKIAKLEFTAQDRSKSTEERKKALKDALALGLQEVEAQKEFTRRKLDEELKYLAATNKVTEQELFAYVKMTDKEREQADQALKDLYNRNEDKVNAIDQLYASLIDLDTRYYEENKRNLSRLTGFEEEINREANEKRKKAEEERLKNLKEFVDTSLKLQQEYEKAVIEGMTGTDKINAEKDYQLKQIDLLQTHLAALGTLTEDHYKYLDGLRAKDIRDAETATRQEQQATIDFWRETYDAGINQRLDFYDYREQLDLKTAELAGELTGQKELEIQKKWLQARIDLLESSQEPILQQQAELLRLQLGLIDKEIEGAKASKNIWDYIGLGDSPEAQEAIKNSVDTFRGVLDDIFSARVDDAQRTRELLDTQISETQRALEAEMDMMRDGYANNVDAKKKELEDLKVAREKALKDEEKAIKAQRALDTVSQLSSLISASADIFKSLAKLGPIGVAVAIATIGTMFGAFAAAKVKASQATKLAAGGTGDETGVITGRRHSQGGERFLDHVEVERGERWGVLNRRASAKYGRAFSEIVTSFNKDRVPIEAVTGDPNIIIDVNQTNERLDRVHGELVRLNSKFGNKRERVDLGDRIIEKIGNKTRIIRK